MSLMIAALLVSAQAAVDHTGPAPTQETSVAAAPKKPKKTCKADDATSGTRMTKRLCLTDEEWAKRSQTMYESSRAGTSATAKDR